MAYLSRATELVGADIQPGCGLGCLRFGMQQDQVEKLVAGEGRTERVEDGEYSYRVLNYEKAGISLFFAESTGKLTSIEVARNSQCTLYDKQIFGLRRREVVSFVMQNLAAKGSGGGVEETDREAIGEFGVYVPDLRLSLYFDLADNLQEVHWGLFYDSADEIVWPDIDAPEP